jgi:hypothetical protein
MEAKLATQQESVFWNLVALALDEYGYSPSKLEWEAWSQTYKLQVNRLGVPRSERVFTIFKDQFSASVADGRLHEAIMRNLLDVVRRVIPGAA